MAVRWNGEWHPLAVRFPMLGEDELRDMAASIADHGQFIACRMDGEGLGLDGRNRVAACALAGVEPRFEPYAGDPVGFIVEVNSERRHLTTGQRAMAVAFGLASNGSRSNGKFAWGSKPETPRGSSRSGWERGLWQAGIVMDHAAELADAVLAGTTALDAAHKVATERRDAHARVEALGGELAALVETGVIDVAEAERRADETERISKLDESLAGRVRGGTLALPEAEIIMRESDKRMAAWAEKIADAVSMFGEMAGNPLPRGLEAKLSDDTHSLLVVVLDALEQEGEIQ